MSKSKKEGPMIDTKARADAHGKLCQEQGLPNFTPQSGVCWSCNRQIFEALDGTSFITGCPYCHRSYCD